MQNRYAALLLPWVAVLVGVCSARAAEVTQRFDPSKYSQAPTACDVKVDRTEMLGFLDASKKQVAGDYYRTMLVELVRESINAGRQPLQ